MLHRHLFLTVIVFLSWKVIFNGHDLNQRTKMIFIMAIKKTSDFWHLYYVECFNAGLERKVCHRQEFIFMHPQILSTQMESLNSHLSCTFSQCNSEFKIRMLSYYCTLHKWLKISSILFLKSIKSFNSCYAFIIFITQLM